MLQKACRPFYQAFTVLGLGPAPDCNMRLTRVLVIPATGGSKQEQVIKHTRACAFGKAHSLVARRVRQPQLQDEQVQGQAGVTPVGALVHVVQLPYLWAVPGPHPRLHLHPNRAQVISQAARPTAASVPDRFRCLLWLKAQCTAIGSRYELRSSDMTVTASQLSGVLGYIQ